MNYLYDTNVISELRKNKMNENFVRFIKRFSVANDKAYICVVTVGEIIKGIEKLRRKTIGNKSLCLSIGISMTLGSS